MDIGIKHSRLHVDRADLPWLLPHLFYGGAALLAHVASVTMAVMAINSDFSPQLAMMGSIYLGLGVLMALVVFFEMLPYSGQEGLIKEVGEYPFGYVFWPERLLCTVLLLVFALLFGRRH